MLSVERMRLDCRDIDLVETADVDVDLVGIGARNIEGVDAAGRAECVLGRAGIEAIGGQRVRPAGELELLRRDDQTQKGLFVADRAVAYGDARQVGRHAEPHAPAMAAAGHCFWHVCSSENALSAGDLSQPLRRVSVRLWAVNLLSRRSGAAL